MKRPEDDGLTEEEIEKIADEEDKKQEDEDEDEE